MSFLQKKEFLFPAFAALSLFLSYVFRLPPLHASDTSIGYIFSQNLDVQAYLFYLWKNPLYLNIDFHHIHPYYLFSSLAGAAGLFDVLLLLFLVSIPLCLYFIYRNQNETPFPVMAWIVSVPYFFYFGFALIYIWQAVFGTMAFLTLSKNDEKEPLYFGLFSSLLSLFYLPAGISALLVYFFMKGYRNLNLFFYTFAYFFAIVVSVYLLFTFFVYDLGFSYIFHFLFLPYYGFEHYFHATGEFHFASLIDNFFRYEFIYCALFLLILLHYPNLYGMAKKTSAGLAVLATLLLLDTFLFTRGASVLPWILAAILISLHGKTEKNILKNFKLIGIIVWIALYVYFGQSFFAKNTTADANDWIVSIKDIPYFHTDLPENGRIHLMDTKIIPANLEMEKQFHAQGMETLLSEKGMAFFDAENIYALKSLKILENKDFNIFLHGGVHPASEEKPYSRARIIWDTYFQTKDFQRNLILR